MFSVRLYNSSDQDTWDRYVENHNDGLLYHLSGWKNVIEKTYGHNSYYLIAEENGEHDYNEIVGILPLIHLKHFLFGNSLISIPFFDMAGVLADNEEVKKNLLQKAVEIGREIKANNIELRHALRQPVKDFFDEQSSLTCREKSHKVRMLLALPKSSELLWNSFKSKHRNKIKIPLREGLETVLGGREYVPDFYHVFSINMRDLGSPVHSKNLIKNVLEEFPQRSKIAMVYKGDTAIACGFFIGFKTVMENPWSSFLREHSRIRPNYLLYWAMLEYASDHEFCYFDFGRSSPDEGTYKFKLQWGANPEPLYWYYLSLNGESMHGEADEKSRYEHYIHYWQKLPVSVTKILGPKIRKYIGL